MLNVTYNYVTHFYRLLGDKGIRSIYGMVARESVPILEQAVEQLADDVDPDYWKATEGNVKNALMDLLVLARARPQGIWAGD